MNWKSQIRKLIGWRPKNARRTAENLHEIAHGNVSEASRLGFSSRKRVFSLKIPEMHRVKGQEALEQLPLFIGEKGRRLPPSSPRRAGGFLWKYFRKKFTPPFSYFRKKLWKYYRSLSDLIFFFFVLPLTNIKWKRLTHGYRNFTKALQKPQRPVLKKRREVLAAQLYQARWLLSQEGRKKSRNL